MAAAAVASGIEDNIRDLVQTKRVRVRDVFQDFDKLRSGYVTVPQFFRCLWQILSVKLTEEEEQALRMKYGLPENGKINYRQFCRAIDEDFNPQNMNILPECQMQQPTEFLGTLRTKQPLSVDSEARLVELLLSLQEYYKFRGINMSAQYKDFDKHHKGVVSESQFYRNFPGPSDIKDEDIKILVEKYSDPNKPGLVNYLNLHNDILAIHKFVQQENNSRVCSKESRTDYVTLFPTEDPTLSEILDKICIAVFKNGIRVIEFFRDHDKLRSGVITENQFVCGLALACGKEAQLQRPEIQKVVEFYRLPDGRVQYREFCDLVENAFSIAHLEKKPTENILRPGKGTLFRGLKALTDQEEEKLRNILAKISDKITKERIMVYQYFTDFDRSTAYTRVITPNQFARILHFLGLNLSEEDVRLLVNKFQDPATKDVNYPAFVQAIDKEYVGHVIEDENNSKPDKNKKVVKSLDDIKPVESPPVLLEELIARIRHIVLVNRLRVIDCFQDYDPLKSGSISISQFRRGLAHLGLSKIGYHDLNDNQFTMLVEQYKNPSRPDQVLWTKFHDDVESVFTQKSLEMTPAATVHPQELFRLPKPGTVDWSNAPKDHLDLCKAAMNHIRNRVEHRRILCKPVFHDFDRHNNGHITRTQFHQCFKILDIPVEENELHALEALYCNDVGINYLKFLEDLQPKEPVPFMYVKRMEEIRLVNAKKMLPEHNPLTDLESVLIKIKTKVCKERIRLYEFMKDYDKLRSGRIQKNLFRRALNLARLNLQESELDILEDRYQSGHDFEFVDYLTFCQEIESIFTKDHLEKHPLEEVLQFKPDKEWAVQQLTEAEEEQLQKCMLRVAEKVYKQRMQLFPLFEDYDRVNIGAVSRSQFRRVLMVLELAGLITDTDFELIWKRFQAQVGGRTDVNYLAFCSGINELARFDVKKNNGP